MKSDTSTIRVQAALPVAVFKEGRKYIAYSPVLDLAAEGQTLKEVKKNFDAVLRIYIEETIAKGTLEQDLRKHGWSKHKQTGWLPPAVSPVSKHQSEDMELKAFVLTPFPSAVTT